MHKAGMPVIVGDAELRERYYAIVVSDEHKADRNPLVRILAVIDYPMQTSIIWPDVASENMPIKDGTICRMHVVQELDSLPAMDYERSREEALGRAIVAAQADHRQDILAILFNHRLGIYRRSRRLCDR